MSVYFAKVGDYIKVGYSTNPERRVRRLFSSLTRYGAPADAPKDLGSRHLIRSIDGTTDTEAAVHAALDDFCVTTEWFLDEPGVRAFITTVTTQAAYPKLARPAGKYESPAMSADDQALLTSAISGMFKGVSA